MSLRLILGNSGSGKSYELYGQIIKAAVQSPEKKFLVIVPEQFTMQTQKELVRLHPDHGLINIDILSFQRLAHRIFEEVGADRRTVLEETGKTLLLRRTAAKKQGELKVLKNNLKKQGYLQQMKSMISELTQYDVDEEKMRQMLDSAVHKPSLYYKLQDIRVLYEGFREELEGKYITAEETLEALCQVAARSKLLRGSVIALDGFTGFTPIQQKLLKELLAISAEVSVTVTIDAGEDFFRIHGEHELFYLSKKTIRTLTELARACACEVLPPTVMEWKTLPRYRESAQMAFLERRLFRSGSMRWEQGKNRENTAPVQNDISLHCAANPVQEAHFAARTIRALLRQGYRYADIAIIVGDLPSYGNYLPKVFAEYEIPCFMDSTRSVFSNPMIEFLRAALEMIRQDFTYTTVFRWLRTGLCGLSSTQTDLLENYVLAAGVRGLSQWKQPFMRRPERLSQEAFAQCEELRALLSEAFLPLAAGMRDAKSTVCEKTRVLHALLCHFGIQQQMAVRETAFARSGQEDLRREYARIYGIVIALFDKMAELLGGEAVSLREYAEMLEAGFEEAKVGMIPPTADRIQVGDIERTRLKDVKVLLFLGLNDGWVPSFGQGGGLLSDMERELLSDSGVELAPTARQNSYIQKFYLYMNLTKPQQKLYLSYCKATADGAAMRPSYVLHSVQKLFPELEITDEDAYTNIAPRVETGRNGLSYLVEGLQKIRNEKPDGAWLELFNWYRGDEDGRRTAEKLVEAAFLTFDERGIGREAAKRLYGEVLVNSVSRLEKFAACAFAHFLQYGLRLQEREEYVFRPVDMGRVCHSVIELFSQKIAQGGYDWFDLNDEVRDALTEECVDEVTRGYGQQILYDSARNEAMIMRMKRILRRTVWALCRQIRSGRFYPANFEVAFSQVSDLASVNIALTAEEKMKLLGRIDRIDVCEKEDSVYVKVIDYKSGSTSFDLAALYHGLQLQLVVYLNAATELEKRIYPDKKIVPAGIFYYHIKDPLLQTTGEPTPEEINRQLLRELRPDGLVNNDEEVFREMDIALEKSSDVLPVSLNKDGSLSKASKAVSGAQFAQLGSFVHTKMQELGRRMMEGETAAVPYQRKQQTACDYCGYKTVCCLDEKIPGTSYRRLKEYRTEELWEKLAKEN